MEHYITDVSTLKIAGIMQVEVKYRMILLIYSKDGIYAIQDKCPHRGVSLSTGQIVGDSIKCKDHGLPISYKTGAVSSERQADFLRLDKASRQIQTYPVTVKDNKIYITL